MKTVSRQAVSARNKRKSGICPVCGIRPLPVDPRYKRNLDIKAALTQGDESNAQIAKRFKVGHATVERIKARPLGEPKLMSRCPVCEENRRHRSTTKGAKVLAVDPGPLREKAATSPAPAA